MNSTLTTSSSTSITPGETVVAIFPTHEAAEQSVRALPTGDC